jgi:hypothetical protein
MSDQFSIGFNQEQKSGHPHDLLARLYREIGISAVAAALEIDRLPGETVEPPVSLDDHRPTVTAEPGQSDIAA